MTARVDVWSVDLDQPLPDPEGVLDAAEQARAAAFFREVDRRRFRVGRYALRTILSRYGAGAASSLRFERNPNGKPRLINGVVRFNLSHSGPRALIAVSFDAEVGVDIEAMRELDDLIEIARLVFHPEEIRELEAIAGEERKGAFFDCWSRREAYLKALGLGLGAAKDMPPVWRRDCVRTRPQPGWLAAALACPAGYRAALAAAATEVEVASYAWTASRDPGAPPKPHHAR